MRIAPRDSWAVFASAPSPCRVRREASVIRPEDPRPTSRKARIATTTTRARSQSRKSITVHMTKRVMTLASSGRPAVTATSWSLPMSETRRWTVSPARETEW